MPITAHQLKARKSHLGSSDVAALCGMNPFQNAYDVWLEKTDQLEDEQREKAWLNSGNEFEPIILKRVEKVLGPIRKNQYRSAKSRGLPLASHIDGIVVENGRPVEAKTSGLFWPVEESWGEPGTDEVPDRVMLQCQVHIDVTGSDLCYVPAMFWGLRQELYIVPRDDAMIHQIEDFITEWWEKHVVQGIAPEACPSLEVVRRVRRETGKSTEISGDAVAKWRRLATAEGKLKKMKEAALAEVLKGLGDAEIGTCGTGVVTYKSEERAGYAVAPTTVRIARFKQAK